MEQELYKIGIIGKLLKWKDEHLTWDASSYSGISSIRLRSQDIWVPGIQSIYNVKTTEIANSFGHGSAALVHSNGSVKWYPEVTYDVPCSTRFRHYPFDSHNCSVLLNAWANEKEITLETLELPMRWSPFSAEGSAWTLFRVEHESLDSADYFRTHVVMVRLHLRRTSTLYRHVSVLPTLVALVSSIFGFWLLPSDSSRYMIGCSNVILMSLTLQHLAATVPAGKDIPLIAAYSAAILCMSGAFLLVTSLTNLLRHSSGQPPEKIIRFSRLHLDRRLCLNIFTNSNSDRAMGELGSDAPDGASVASPEEDRKRKDWSTFLSWWTGFPFACLLPLMEFF